MAVNKIKRGKAIAALTKAGMAQSTAERYVRMLDLDKPLAPQITELAEDMADLFGNVTDDDEDDTSDGSMTARETIAARLKGGSEHMERKTFRREAQPRPSTAPATAREAAEHLTKNLTRNAPPVQKWREPVRDINTTLPTRERPASADALAARLRR